jgi:hypothetical protein
MILVAARTYNQDFSISKCPVLKAMPIWDTGLEPCAVARLQSILPFVCYQHDFPVQHVDKLVLV